MPIYKVGKMKNKEGLQRYNVRVNYISDKGEYKQITRITYGKDNAKMLERELQHEIENYGKNSVRKMTVKQLFEEYFKVKKYEVRESTLEKAERNFNFHVAPTLANIQLDKLSFKVLQEWKMSIEEREGKKLALKTKRNIFSDFRTMLNYAVKMEYISKNPLTQVGNFKDALATKKEIKFYTPEEFKKFIDTAKDFALQKQKQDKNLYEWNYYVFFNIAFYTGARKGEIHALRWSDIDGSYLSIKRSLTQKLLGRDVETPPKNRSSIRTIQIPLPLMAILDEHRKRQKKLFNFDENNRILGDERSLRDTSIQNRNILYAESAGVDRIRIHDFRHSHASLLANMGINIQEVARRLGHSKIEMTWNTYSHLYPKEEEKAMAVLNAV